MSILACFICHATVMFLDACVCVRVCACVCGCAYAHPVDFLSICICMSANLFCAYACAYLSSHLSIPVLFFCVTSHMSFSQVRVRVYAFTTLIAGSRVDSLPLCVGLRFRNYHIVMELECADPPYYMWNCANRFTTQCMGVCVQIHHTVCGNCVWICHTVCGIMYRTVYRCMKVLCYG